MKHLAQQHHPVAASAQLRELAAFAETSAPEFDSYGTGSTLQAFESSLATLFGQEAAVFCPTGTAAQLAICTAHTQGTTRRKLLLHPTSHLVFHDCLRSPAQQEAWRSNAASNLPGFTVSAMGEAHRPLTLEDVTASGSIQC